MQFDSRQPRASAWNWAETQTQETSVLEWTFINTVKSMTKGNKDLQCAVVLGSSCLDATEDTCSDSGEVLSLDGEDGTGDEEDELAAHFGFCGESRKSLGSGLHRSTFTLLYMFGRLNDGCSPRHPRGNPGENMLLHQFEFHQENENVLAEVYLSKEQAICDLPEETDHIPVIVVLKGFHSLFWAGIG